MHKFALCFMAFLAIASGGCDINLNGGSGTLCFVAPVRFDRKAEKALKSIIFAHEDIFIRLPDLSGRRRAMLLSDWMKSNPRPRPFIDKRERVHVFSKKRTWDAELIFAECFRSPGSRYVSTFSRVVPTLIRAGRVTKISVHVELNLLTGTQERIYAPPAKARWYHPSTWRHVGRNFKTSRRYCE